MRAFRQLRLPALALATGIAGVSCGKDSGTGPSGPPPSVTLTPQLDAAAERALGSLDAFDLGVESARLVLRAGAETVLDTTITRTNSQVELPIASPLARRLATAALTAELEVRRGSMPMFSGTGTVSAAENAGAATLVLRYVGPGAEIAQVRIAPRDLRLQTGATQLFTATATNANGQPATLVMARWSALGDTAGTMTPSGAFTAAARRADGRVVVLTPSGVRDTVALRVLPPAQAWVVVSGGTQEAPAGRAPAQPIVLELRATDGLPLDGVEATFATAVTGASVGQARDTTDAQGRVELRPTLGRALGAQQFQVEGGGLAPFAVTATATVGFGTTIAADSGNAQQGVAGDATAAPLVVRVLDETGQPVAGATVAFAVTAGNGTPFVTTATTDATGRARTGYLHSTTAGAEQVTATLMTASGPVTATFALTARAGWVARVVAVDTTTRSDTILATLGRPLVARAEDRFGNPIAGASVRWRVTSGLATVATVDTTATVTGAEGTASRTPTLGQRTGTVTVQAYAVFVDTVAATFTVTVRAGSPWNFTVVAGSGQSGAPGATLPIAPTARVRDRFGNNAVGATVTFAVTSGGGSLASTQAVVDSLGRATAGAWTLGLTGAQQVRLSTEGSLSVATFNATVTAGAAYGVRVASGFANGAALYGEETSFSVDVYDVHGNRVTAGGEQVHFAVAGGGGQVRAGTSGSVYAGTATSTASFGGIANILWRLGTTGRQQLQAYVVGAGGDTTTLELRGATTIVAGDASTDYSTRLRAGADTASVAVRARVLDGTTGIDSARVSWSADGGCWLIDASGSQNAQSLTSDGGYTTMRVVSPGFGETGSCVVWATFGTQRVAYRAYFAPAGARLRWTGAASTAWTNAANWADAVTGATGTPIASDVIFVPKHAARYPQLAGALTARGLVLDDSATLNQAGFALAVDSVLLGGYQSALLNGGTVSVGSATHPGRVRIAGTGALTLGGATCAPGELRVEGFQMAASSVTVRCPVHFVGTNLSVGTQGAAPALRFQTVGAGKISFDEFEGASIGVIGHATFAGVTSTLRGGQFALSGNLTLTGAALHGGEYFVLGFGGGTTQTLAINGDGNTLGMIRVYQSTVVDQATGTTTHARTTLNVTSNAARFIPAVELDLSWYSNTAVAYASRATLGTGVTLEVSNRLSLLQNTGATVNAGATLRAGSLATMGMGSGAFINGAGTFAATSGCAAYTTQITTTTKSCPP